MRALTRRAFLRATGLGLGALAGGTAAGCTGSRPQRDTYPAHSSFAYTSC